ncbi:hypothetical protein [Arcticibacterium luteifluviistationis]|uniref:START domain-containing protein n=1 Tax=Arcticibacterium luteifluviistationis TaxID=1784714 RepID=A0A2Z4G6S7_9BACT|nr:hypothetical protein [Arcticibacterium luteifluviistationis]AWV96820.1 hypothetical protein DJ013_00915 [Arcticibacterium luteifluviistationis]
MKNFSNGILSKNITTANISVYVCLLFLVSPFLNGCSRLRIELQKDKSYKEWKAYQWKEIKKSPNSEVKEWIIYSRKLRGTNFLEYKIEGKVESTASTSLSAFKGDIIRHTNGSKIDEKLTTYKLMEKSEDSLLTYVIHDESFPFKDTEMCLRYKFFTDEDRNSIVKWNEAWDKCEIQPSKKLKRIEMFRGSWIFSSTENSSTQAVNIVQFDPKGMPMWLVKPMVIKFLRKGLENIRKITL